MRLKNMAGEFKIFLTQGCRELDNRLIPSHNKGRIFKTSFKVL